ncbi:MAG: hypothetical protein KF861_22170, partial [Planctomycetaceae bacterium]|nr:hypothetical protein [Planctomycetaceae bacterium]
MKGPGMRVDFDVRRCWRCTTCGSERRTWGDQTAVCCAVCPDGPLMTLVEIPRIKRGNSHKLDLIVSLHPDDVNCPPYIPPQLDAAAMTVAVVETTTVVAVTVESPMAPAAATAQAANEGGRPSQKRQGRRREKPSKAAANRDKSTPP